MTDAPLVLPLEAVDPTDPDTLGRVGGKAANLGALVRAGFPVPAGVCLTTAAYRRAVGSALDALLAEGTDSAGLAEKARAAVLAVPVPDEVADAVRATCPDGPVAVRSSATAEDLPDASFAGQQDTFLNIVGDDAVLDAVRRCWASLWTDRAVAYRGAHDIDHAAVTLAVVIQSMVDARWAGVLFTADPVTGRRGQAVIDAAPGLGESVVSGAVDPEHVVVEPGGEIVSRHAGAGGTVVRALPGGGTETVAHASGAASLDDADVRTLARLGRRVEALFGAPQDIEWALDGAGRAWLTQSRPITTLYPLVPGRPGLRLFLSANVAQGVFRPFTPSGLSAARHLASGVAGLLGAAVDDPEQGPPMVSEAGERVFVDLTDILRSRVGRLGAAGVLGVMETRSAEVIATQLDRPELAVTRRSPLPTVRRVGRIALRYRIPPAVVGAWTNPARARDRAFALVRDAAATLPAPAGAGREERVDRARWMLTACFAPMAPRIAPAPAAGFLALGLAARLLRGRARPGELGTVLRGLPHNVTTEMDLALWDLAVRLRDDPATVAALTGTPPAELAGQRGTWPPVLATGLGAFLAAHGRRAVAEIDLGLPRWSDDPTHLLGVLANYVRLDDAGRAPDVVFARSAAEAEAMIDALAARAGGAARTGRGRGPAPGPRPRRAARAAEVLAGHGARGRPDRARRGGRRPGVPGPSGDGRRRVLPEPRRGPGGRRPPLRRAGAARDLRARAAAPARAAHRALGRHRARGARHHGRARRRCAHRRPGLGGHRHGPGPGDHRPAGRPPRARRRARVPVHRPRLDAAVPHRRRAGDGDGRLELPRRGRRPRVRPARRRRRPRRRGPIDGRGGGARGRHQRAGGAAGDVVGMSAAWRRRR